jgi:DNA-binding NarL/FixJ family response regulator
MDGFEATRAIKREFARTPVLVLTALEHPEHLLEALKAGASGYVLKDLTAQRIVEAIRKVLSGESSILSARLLSDLLSEKQEK